MVKLVFLTEAFFNDHASYGEIEKKKDRPHAQILLKVNGHHFCIPFRSNISHPNAIWTDKANKCGIDLSKAVVITDPAKYIDSKTQPYLRPHEYNSFKRISEYEIAQKLETYIEKYKKAKAHMEIPRNKILVECSTLQYFEEFI